MIRYSSPFPTFEVFSGLLQSILLEGNNFKITSGLRSHCTSKLWDPTHRRPEVPVQPLLEASPAYVCVWGGVSVQGDEVF